MRPLHFLASGLRGTLKKPTAFAITNKTTAMRSCVRRKKRGVVVTLRTHLLLRMCGSHEPEQNEQIGVHHDHLHNIVSIL